MKSRVKGEQVQSCADTVTLYGCWTACIRDTLSDSYLYSRRRPSLVGLLDPCLVVRLCSFGSLVLVNGRHLSSDITFIEKRRRGLVRFVNALVRHPVLSQEQLIVMFLTVPTVGSGAPSARTLLMLLLGNRSMAQAGLVISPGRIYGQITATRAGGCVAN